MRGPLCAVFLALAQPALAAEPAATSLSTGVSTAAANQPEAPESGFELRWLPLESPSSVTDFLGLNLAGAALDRNGGLLLRGGRAADTALVVDGFRVRRLALPLSLVSTVAVTTADQGAEWAEVPGGLVELETRGGANRWQAGVEAHHDFRSLRTTEVMPMVSGPLVRDRLFLALALRAQDAREAQGLATEFERLAPRQTGELGGGLKLTWLPRAGHRLESLTLVDLERTDNAGTLRTERDAQVAFARRDLLTGLRWVGRLTPALTARVQAGLSAWRDEEMPQQCRDTPDTCESTVALIAPGLFTGGNWIRHLRQRGNAVELASGLEARVPSPSWLEERLRVTSRLEARQFSWMLHVPGDRVLEYNATGAVPERETVTFANDPRYEPAALGWRSFGGSSLATSHGLELEARLHERVWITPGLSLVTSSARADGLVDLHDLAATPHLSLAWDATGDGRTWLRAGTHERVDAGLESFAQFALGTPVSRSCRWDDATASFSKDCAFQGGPNSLGLPCSPTAVDGFGRACSQRIRMPRSREVTLGAERELWAGLRLAADLVYRRASGLPDIVETNWVFGGAAVEPGPYRNGRPLSVYDASTDPHLYQRYLGATISLRREVGSLRLLVTYTESRHRGSEPQGSFDFVVRPPGQEPQPSYRTGALADERKHSLRGMAGYDFRGYAWLSAVFSAESGLKGDAVDLREVGNPLQPQRSPIGVNPDFGNAPAAPPPPKSYRRFNLQGRLKGKRIVGQDLDLYADVINLFDWAGVIQLEPSGAFARFQDRRFFRLGLEYRY